ncbi:tyrosine-type recombinase/integrase [Adhaeretor mobilis]|uniref:Phage integrase family protein n=1 Tax=Adhaeretor mobilis TaxID=1930276 RepID=A0A517MYH9_9BACT|nr:site-specific integrase [Adhaeretor mobilis]QDS99935.1 Phage integrase family protein [Adhaeretor mobilis]
MPKLSNSLPKYRKHRGSGQAVVTLSGRDYYLGPHGTKTSKLEYDRLIAEWLSSGRSPAFGTSQDDLSIAELLAAYLRYAKDYYGTGPKSEYFHMRRLAQLIARLFGRTSAAEFGPLRFKAVRDELVSGGISRTYANSSMRRVARIFKWGAAEGILPPSVPQSLAMVPGLRKGRSEARETAPVGPVSPEVVEATLAELPETIADMVQLQLLTAARPKELCDLRPCDLDRSGEVWVYRPASHKTEHHGRDRTVLIGPQGQGILLKYLARDPETCCFRPCDSEAKRLAAAHASRVTPLSCGNRPGSKAKRRGKRKLLKQPGERYSTDAYRRAIHRACDRAFPHPEFSQNPTNQLTTDELAELKEWQAAHRWSPNRLRHTAATEIRREFGLEAAQVILGHSAADVTQIYAERDLAKGLDVARKIG